MLTFCCRLQLLSRWWRVSVSMKTSCASLLMTNTSSTVVRTARRPYTTAGPGKPCGRSRYVQARGHSTVWFFRLGLNLEDWTDDSSVSQLSSYLLCMSYSDCEVWAGDITGKLHSFSMRDGTLKAVSQVDVGHTALITGIHRSPGSLYTCSSDRTVKVSFDAFFFIYLIFF